MDCVEGMQQFPDKYFDLAVVDPPYGIAQDGHRENNRSKLAKSKNYDKSLWDQDRPTKEYFLELERVSKHQIIWGGNHLIDLIGKSSPCWLVWDKDNSGNFADCELAYTSFDTAVRKFKFTWNGMIQDDMKNKEIRIHPTQKPKALYNWIFSNYAKSGVNVLDTHLGSGNSRCSAYDNNINFYAFEIVDKYLKDSIDSFKKHICQQKLFY